MNKENIDYTSEEFWAAAPKDATHWEPESDSWIGGWIKSLPEGIFYSNSSGEWCIEFRQEDDGYEELSKTFVPRPSTFTKPVQEASVNNTEWDGTGVPPAGIDCEFQHRNAPNGIWHPTTIRYSSHAYIIYVDTICDEEACYRVNDGCAIDFRPIKKEPTIQEKILEAWKAQGIDFAYDNEDSKFSFKVLVDFVVNNFGVKGKD